MPLFTTVRRARSCSTVGGLAARNRRNWNPAVCGFFRAIPPPLTHPSQTQSDALEDRGASSTGEAP